MTVDVQATRTVASGIAGLDTILQGGFVRDRLYLIEGAPGSGKTTLALQFLLDGVRQGESVLYITLSESAAELSGSAASHGWSLAGIDIHEVLPSEQILQPEEQYSIFHPGDVESRATTDDILAAVKRARPRRVVLDSLSELQLPATSALLYRRQVLALKQFFASRNCTTLLLDDETGSNGDRQVRSVAHGVIALERMPSEYGCIRRQIEVIKLRGVAFAEGLHDYRIVTGGLVVYPRLVAARTHQARNYPRFSTGVAALDDMLGGGLEQGTSTLIAGPSGAGKSSLATQLAAAALVRGEPVAMFIFDESAGSFLHRARAQNVDFGQAVAQGQLQLHQIDPAQMSPGEFTHAVCAAADAGARMVVIDSLQGFQRSMPSEKLLATHLHELLTYLGQSGVATVLVGMQQAVRGERMAVESSFLADNIIMLHYFEAGGAVCQAISVYKKRGGEHKRTIRHFRIAAGGVEIGAVLTGFHGILTGTPWLADSEMPAMAASDG